LILASKKSMFFSDEFPIVIILQFLSLILHFSITTTEWKDWWDEMKTIPLESQIKFNLLRDFWSYTLNIHLRDCRTFCLNFSH
jgi:hypothetical protein